MQNRKRDTDVQNRLLDSVGEGEGGMFWENSMKQVYYQGWNRSPAQVGCMRQVLRAGALGRPRGMRWRGRWEGRSGRGTHVNPWLIHVNIWQKSLQYCKVINLQLIKINGKNKKKIKYHLIVLLVILCAWYFPYACLANIILAILCKVMGVQLEAREDCSSHGICILIYMLEIK